MDPKSGLNFAFSIAIYVISATFALNLAGLEFSDKLSTIFQDP